MTSSSPRWRSLGSPTLPAVLLAVLLAAACTGEVGGSGTPVGTPTAGASSAPSATFSSTGEPTDGGPAASSAPADPYADYDRQVHALLTSVATWSLPHVVAADVTTRIGLSFGPIEALRPQIDELIPDAVRTDAGTYQVGATMSVQLSADTDDADIAAPTTLNRSTGSSVDYLFTWQVRPRHPADHMLFTAQVTIPLRNGHTDAYSIPLSVAVRRTVGYTAGQVFSAWATWVSIATVFGGAVTWWWRRRTAHRARRAVPPPRAKVRRAG